MEHKLHLIPTLLPNQLHQPSINPHLPPIALQSPHNDPLHPVPVPQLDNIINQQPQLLLRMHKTIIMMADNDVGRYGDCFQGTTDCGG